MRTSKLLTALLVVALGASITAATGCRRVPIEQVDGKTRVTKADETISAQGATSADVSVEMGAGRLFIAGGSNDLMEGDFTYAPASLKPEIDYKVTGGKGDLRVRQPDIEGLPLHLGDAEYLWDLKFSQTIPMDMTVEMGAGDSVLQVGNLDLDALRVALGAGTSEIDLTGSRTKDLEVRVEQGAGRLTLLVPASGVGVRIIGAEDGVGDVSAPDMTRDGDDYVNDAVDTTAAPQITVRVERGVGEIVVKVLD